jgi:hypothetical protein
MLSLNKGGQTRRAGESEWKKEREMGSEERDQTVEDNLGIVSTSQKTCCAHRIVAKVLIKS